MKKFKAINLLNEIVAEEIQRNDNGRPILREFSEKTIKKLLEKFKTQSPDTPESQILADIQLFKQIQPSLDTSKRDIEKYDYADLDKLVRGVRNNKEIETLFKKYKGPGVDNEILRSNLKKYMAIKPFLDDRKREMIMQDSFHLGSYMTSSFRQDMITALVQHFSKKRDNMAINNAVLVAYATDFTNLIDQIPLNYRPINEMTFTEFEHLVDSITAELGDEYKGNIPTDIETINAKRFPEEGITIFAPKGKDDCVRLNYGRSFCISRSGVGNMYYDYRLNRRKTIYYVLDEKEPVNSRTYVTVVLVSPDGRFYFADKTNTNRYGGGTEFSWAEIVREVPSLGKLSKNGKDLFPPSPLTRDEEALIAKVSGISVPKDGDVMARFNNDYKMVEMWLDVNSPQLDSGQYGSLPTELQKKYIALGFDLSSAQLAVSTTPALQYYITRKKTEIENKDPQKLSAGDISLLRLPMFSEFRKGLRGKIESETKKAYENADVKIHDLSAGISGIFLALYGMDSLFDILPDTITELTITNNAAITEGITFTLPESVSRFKKLNWISLENCIEDPLPQSICDLESLQFLSLQKNAKLTRIPECLADLPNLRHFTYNGSPIVNADIMKKRKK